MKHFHEQLQALTAWQMIQAGENAARVSSPFVFGDDGTCIAFSLFFTDNGFYLCDNADQAMLASAMGATMNKDKIRSLNETSGVRLARFDESGEIQAHGDIDDLQDALFDATKLALSLSFRYEKWLPKFNHARFKASVERTLLRLMPDRVIQNHSVKGISGHDVRFPFAVKKTDGNLTYIETVAKDGDKLDWSAVYQVHGKFSDVKLNDDPNHRLAFLEDGTADFGEASTLLAAVTNIRTINAPDLREALAA